MVVDALTKYMVSPILYDLLAHGFWRVKCLGIKGEVLSPLVAPSLQPTLEHTEKDLIDIQGMKPNHAERDMFTGHAQNLAQTTMLEPCVLHLSAPRPTSGSQVLMAFKRPRIAARPDSTSESSRRPAVADALRRQQHPQEPQQQRTEDVTITSVTRHPTTCRCRVCEAASAITLADTTRQEVKDEQDATSTTQPTTSSKRQGNTTTLRAPQTTQHDDKHDGNNTTTHTHTHKRHRR